MTGLLKDALTERAAAEQTPHLDLDAIVRTGDRRVRRRRVVSGLVAATAVAAVVAGGLVALGRPSADAPPAGRTAPFAERKVTWAGGGKIHYGDRHIPVSPVIEAFVQTDTGFVLVDPAGDVYVADGNTVDRIGTGNQWKRLEADDTGSLAGWVDYSSRVPEFVVYDVAARREIVRTAEGNTTPATQLLSVVGIDGNFAYFGASDGLRRWDLATGGGVLMERRLRVDAVKDIAAGRFAIERFNGQSANLVVSERLADRAPRFAGLHAKLSPGGAAMFTHATDVMRVYSIDRRAEVQFRRLEYRSVYPFQWIDDDRFVAVAPTEFEKPIQLPATLLICSINAAGCEAADDGNLARYAGDKTRPSFRLPTGRAIEDGN